MQLSENLAISVLQASPFSLNHHLSVLPAALHSLASQAHYPTLLAGSLALDICSIDTNAANVVLQTFNSLTSVHSFPHAFLSIAAERCQLIRLDLFAGQSSLPWCYCKVPQGAQHLLRHGRLQLCQHLQAPVWLVERPCTQFQPSSSQHYLQPSKEPQVHGTAVPVVKGSQNTLTCSHQPSKLHVTCIRNPLPIFSRCCPENTTVPALTHCTATISLKIFPCRCSSLRPSTRGCTGSAEANRSNCT